MGVLKIYDDEDLRSLPSGVWGIKEPTFQYCDTPRMKGPYTIHSLSVQLSHGYFIHRWIDGGAALDFGGEAATDEDSNPLDVILIPGKVRGLFTRIYSNKIS